MAEDATKSVALAPLGVRAQWRVEVTRGPAPGQVLQIEQGLIRVGSASTNEIVLKDPKVSRHHLILEVKPNSVRVRDLGSKNGTFYRGSRLETAELPLTGAILTLGTSELTLSVIGTNDAEENFALSPRESCGAMLGQTDVMRHLFAQVERIATSTATVLVNGETGTGKELVAQAIHDLSARRDGPFVIVDCGSIPKDLVESELFGHVRGAFTGATADRRGAFELGHDGTVVLDEIGELSLELQPRLLRVLETGQVKPVGSSRSLTCDVRVIAASHRDLASDVAEGRFRQDLFYRLAVVHLLVPPLRARMDDVPLLAEHFAKDLGVGIDPASMAALRAYHWPGNVRQLRNVIARAAAMSSGQQLLRLQASDFEGPAAPTPAMTGPPLPYKAAKDEMLAKFTREYLDGLLKRHQGNVSAAAREAQVDRNWIVALCRRVGVRIRE